MSREKSLSKVIVSLDDPQWSRIFSLVDELGEDISFYKVGSISFSAYGTILIEELKKRGKKIFLDLKYHDIPNTVEIACMQAAIHGVDMLSIHLLGGRAMIKGALKGVSLSENSTKILGISILTSTDEKEMQEQLQTTNSLQNQVFYLVEMGHQSGINGIVCSPLEVALIRERISKDIIIVTPGIRLKEDVLGDQKRVMSPREAIDQGSDYIVMGRPITGAKDKKGQLEKIYKDLVS